MNSVSLHSSAEAGVSEKAAAVGVGAVAMRSLVDHPNSLCFVGECREAEERFGTIFTDAFLQIK